MYSVRRWVPKHARGFETIYNGFERLLIGLAPLFRHIGWRRVEKPAAAIERVVKGFLFDTRMCGSCTLGSTGMVCPMNCPKKMRNGPCGGVRANGHCEVEPDMPCVWVDIYAGSRRMKEPGKLLERQRPVDHRLEGSSAWLREVRRATGEEDGGRART